VTTSSPERIRAAGIRVNSEYPGFVTVDVTTEELLALAAMQEVQFIEPGTENILATDVSVPFTGASLLHTGFVNSTPYKGNGVIVLIYDTGIDWTHKDFRKTDTTKSRILAIWDQTLAATGAEAPPSGFSYGVEYTQTQIEDELDGTPAAAVRERDINGHGTHVAGIAAGNGNALTNRYVGMAPEADIIVVKGGDGSFSETRMIDGLTYAANKAAQFGKPLVLNWSIGGQTGPHDGTRSYEVAVNSFVSNPGRVVCISAGNDGASAIHIGGTVVSGSPVSIPLVVPTYSATVGTNNDYFFFDLWFEGNPSVSATVQSPNGITYTRDADESGSAPSTSDGTIEMWNYVSPLNGHRNVQLKVSDASVDTPRAGSWTLTFSIPSGSSTYDAWLSSRTVGTTSVTLTGGNTSKTVSMPATAAGAITVASQVTRWGWPTATTSYTYTGTDRTGNIASSSAIGPTRLGAQKPDIAAPGQGIGAALSRSVDPATVSTRILPGGFHHVTQGTSMAAPHVTGASALMLSASSSLTASQIKSILQSTANTDAFTATTPNYTWGYGKMDILEAVARVVNPTATITRNVLAYDTLGSSSSIVIAGGIKQAVRVTPPLAGRLTGLNVNITTPSGRPVVGTGPLQCEVYTSEGGAVGTKIGSTVQHPFTQLSPATYNYISMLDAGVSLDAGADYFIVLSVQNAGDTVRVRADQTTSATRSLSYNGSAWSARTNNLRIQAIVTTTSASTGAENIAGIPLQYELKKNFPNPFNPSTTIAFSLPREERVRLAVYDILGREMSVLIDEVKVAGRYQTTWDGRSNGGMHAASGAYFIRMEAPGFVATERMLLLK
jgi:subtilisin family serine protease